MTNDYFDVLIVGAGPAGLAAACCAAESGRTVGVVDDNPDAGGQIWRGEAAHPTDGDAKTWFERVRRAAPTLLAGTEVFGQAAPGRLSILRSGEMKELRYNCLVIATGARERFLPFPGWTLPGVAGAGGLQALVKSGFDVRGQRVAVAGSGPLLLAVAAYLRRRGANVVLVAEQTPRLRLLRFAWAMLAQPAKLRQALELESALRDVPYRFGCWPTAAEGRDRLTSVVFTDGRDQWRERCDWLACGFGLTPNTELASLIGCDVAQGRVTVDDLQQTSVARVYAAGEATGIGGVDLSLVEGQIAGYAAAGRDDEARRLFVTRDKALRFAEALQRAFALRDELRALPAAETPVCRCEDVNYQRMRRYGSWREAKLQTRCGMGPCQGRVCRPAAEFLFDWEGDHIRPPLVPVPLAHLAAAQAAALETEVEPLLR